MNILVLAWNFPPALGGIEVVASHLVDGLIGLGHEVHVVARYSPDVEARREIERSKAPGLLRYQWFSLLRARRILRKHNVDLIVCPGIVNGPVAFLLSCMWKTPYVLLAHGSDVAYGNVFYRAGMRFLFKRAARVCANSQNTGRLLEQIGCARDRIRVIHPGVDADRFPARVPERVHQIRETHGWGQRPILLTTGRLVRRKGVLECIENVIPHVMKKYPDVLYIVAGDEPTSSLVHHERLLDQTRKRVSELGLDAHVVLTGKVSDDALRDLYYVADLFLMAAVEIPGDVEGFGIVFLEAALAGLPAVSTRTGGIPEAVEDGVSGVLHAPGDWDGIAGTVAALLGNSARRDHMGMCARQRVITRFAWPVIALQYSDGFAETAALPS